MPKILMMLCIVKQKPMAAGDYMWQLQMSVIMSRPNTALDNEAKIQG